VSGRPLLVAHRALNDPRAARAAAEAGADLAEADVHMRHGRLELRHPRRLGPVLWDREGLAVARGPAQNLEPALAALSPAVEAVLDLKSGPPRLADAALAAARTVLGERPVTIASRRWAVLERLRGAPGVRLVHSAASERELARLLRMAASGRLDGASVRADLLAPGAAAALREATGLLMTWPVADARQAERLARDGATALIVDDLALIARLAVRPARRGMPPR
jgi:glycerophosphoryl diester phosphodiesterase